jgi:hypothetical protein
LSKILAPFKEIGKGEKKVKAPKSPKKEKKKEEAVVIGQNDLCSRHRC